jgi:hypothetical protein
MFEKPTIDFSIGKGYPYFGEKTLALGGFCDYKPELPATRGG